MTTEEDLHRTNNSEGTHRLLIHILVLEVEGGGMIGLSGRRLNSKVVDQRTEGYFYVLIFLAQIETYDRPQTKFAKVMFSQVSVCPQGGCLPNAC